MSLPEGGGISLGILAKEPLAGKVKTRLCPPLTPEEAAALYHRGLQQTIATLSPLQPRLFYSGNIRYFQKNFPDRPLSPQCEGDLGMRMSQALHSLHSLGNECALIVGSDAPDLPLPLIRAAYAALKTVEVVTIPARDGGYLLIGERGYHPALFHGVSWSTPAVLQETRTICAAQQIPYAEVGGWEDIDNASDLWRLCQRSPELEVSHYAAELLQRYGFKG